MDSQRVPSEEEEEPGIFLDTLNRAKRLCEEEIINAQLWVNHIEHNTMILVDLHKAKLLLNSWTIHLAELNEHVLWNKLNIDYCTCGWKSGLYSNNLVCRKALTKAKRLLRENNEQLER